MHFYAGEQNYVYMLICTVSTRRDIVVVIYWFFWDQQQCL